MKNVQILDKSKYTKCWTCGGLKQKSKCKACKGTGIWKEPNYIIVAEQPKGQKIAFQSDFCK